METAKDLASCAPPEGKTWSLFLKVDILPVNQGIRFKIDFELKFCVIRIIAIS